MSIRDDVIIEPPGCIALGPTESHAEIHEIVCGRASLDFGNMAATASASASAAHNGVTLLQRPNQTIALNWGFLTQPVSAIAPGVVILAAEPIEGGISFTAVNYGTAAQDPAAVNVSYLGLRGKIARF